MKTHQHRIAQGAFGLAVILLVTNLCFGGEKKTSAPGKEQPTKTKTAAVEKKKTSARRTTPKQAQITGSMIDYKVEPGKKTPETGLTVTVIDPNSPVNRGYASPIEALKQVPSVYSGR